jgi:regulator of cell morphogenesis and NO signaling
MNIPETATIGSFVAKDYGTALIFSKYGFDLCHKGQITIDEVCYKNNLNKAQLLTDLNTLL